LRTLFRHCRVSVLGETNLLPTVSSAQRCCLYVQLSNGLDTALSCCGPTFFGIREWSCWHVPVWPAKSKARYLAENNSNEDRFARQDQQAYSRWSSLGTLAIIVIVIGILVLMYFRR
jgi:hypothetical protein